MLIISIFEHKTEISPQKFFFSTYSHVSQGSGKIWSKIHRQLNRRFGGSTGSLSSTSPISEQDLKKLEAQSSEGIHAL